MKRTLTLLLLILFCWLPLAHAQSSLPDSQCTMNWSCSLRLVLTPLEALQTATVNPANYLNLSHTLGTIEKGKRADLLLLDANPLETIGNTRHIAGLVVNGKYLPRESLDKMLPDVEVTAARSSGTQ